MSQWTRGGMLLSCVTCAMMSLGAQAQAQDTVVIQFEPGATGTTINGAVRGQDYVDYVIETEAGQTMYATLTVTDTNGHGSAFFNILPAGKDYDGLYIGSMDDDSSAEVTFPENGAWAIRVYLMGNDADTDRTVGYSIDVSIPPGESGSGSSASSGGDDTVRVAFAPGTTGDELTGALAAGESRRYLIGAGEGQFLYVRLAAEGAGQSYQIFNPDGSFLLEQTEAAQEYRGQLWQSGDHVIEVINRGSGTQSYNLIIGIE